MVLRGARMLMGGRALGAALLLVHSQLGRPAGTLRDTRAAEEEGQTMLLDEVRKANDGFYAALDRMIMGDLSLMDQVWSHSSDATLMDPFGGRQVGWDQVRKEFERSSKLTLRGHAEPRDLLIRTDADTAYAVCVEYGNNTGRDGKEIPVNHRATNVFRRENGQRKMIHHHTDVAPGLQQGFGGP